MHDVITADLGPEFYGFYGQVAGKIVCVMTPAVEHDPAARRIVRDLIRRQGGDCASCRACPVGQADT